MAKIDLTDWQHRELDKRHVCSLFTISPATVERWVRSGRLPQPKRYSARLVRWVGSDLAKVKAAAT